jgi:hypothetical protein
LVKLTKKAHAKRGTRERVSPRFCSTLQQISGVRTATSSMYFTGFAPFGRLTDVRSSGGKSRADEHEERSSMRLRNEATLCVEPA